MTRAEKGRRETAADEMLAGLQAFARDLKELPAEEVKAKYRQRTVEVDFRPAHLRGCGPQASTGFDGLQSEDLRGFHWCFARDAAELGAGHSPGQRRSGPPPRRNADPSGVLEDPYPSVIEGAKGGLRGHRRQVIRPRKSPQ